MSPLERLERAAEAFNQRDAGAVAELYAADGVVLDPQHPEPIRGRDDIRESYAQLFRGFPDATVRIQQRAFTGGRVSYELRLTGTHTGPLATPDGDVPPRDGASISRQPCSPTSMATAASGRPGGTTTWRS
jgi:uncharacterized protein (TIGR02246 family)